MNDLEFTETAKLLIEGEELSLSELKELKEFIVNSTSVTLNDLKTELKALIQLNLKFNNFSKYDVILNELLDDVKNFNESYYASNSQALVLLQLIKKYELLTQRLFFLNETMNALIKLNLQENESDLSE